LNGAFTGFDEIVTLNKKKKWFKEKQIHQENILNALLIDSRPTLGSRI